MTLSAKLNHDEFMSARRVVWAPRYTLNLFNNYVFRRLWLIMLMVLCVVLSVERIGQHHRLLIWLSGSVLGAFFFGVLMLLIWRSQRPSSKLLAKINADLPETLRFEDSGVELREQDDVLVQFPWHAFKGWREGSSVFPHRYEAGKDAHRSHITTAFGGSRVLASAIERKAWQSH